MTTTWHTDTNSGFDVVIIGSGTPSAPAGTWSFGGSHCVSPSGLWTVYADDSTTWDLLQQKWTIINGGGAANFTGPATAPVPQPFLAYPAYQAGFVQADILWYTRNTAIAGASGWSGSMTYKVAALDPVDPSTWQWVTRYWGSGPAIT